MRPMILMPIAARFQGQTTALCGYLGVRPWLVSEPSNKRHR
ncbi:MAG: hypothetical protein JWM80_2108 [Cyanobacteria bacterium RYN_339]|nr:hypothetical protein [Cyanobacteria bacterium RYN_339]